MLNQFSINIENNTYGYDRTLTSMKDFVWVYNASPTISATQHLAACNECAGVPRANALESNSEDFQSSTVTLIVFSECNLGVVLFVARRGDRVNSIRMALKEPPERVAIKRPLCQLHWPDVHADKILRACCRKNVFCAVRFSKPSPSREARDRLCSLVRRFFPAHTEEGILPNVLKFRPQYHP